MPKARITKRSVDAVLPGTKDTYLWDTDLAGFGLKVTPGGARIYLVQYRRGGRGAPTRRVTIGRHGSPWTPDEARQEARRLLAEVDLGGDPAQAQTLEREDLTVAELCDLYLAEGCTTKKPSTLRADKGRIRCHIKPLLGSKRVRALTRADGDRLLRDVLAGKTAGGKRSAKGGSVARGGKGAASQSVMLLRAMLSFAVARGLRPDNPITGIKVFPVRRMERFLSVEEMGRLGRVLENHERDGGNVHLVAAIRLLILTGCRKSEILKLRWEHVDAAWSCLRLPDSKTGAKVVPLGEAALDVLDRIPRIAGNPFVIPGEAEGSHLVNIDRTWNTIRKVAKLDGLRLHDLRHSFASVGAGSGDSLLVIGKLLGHSQASTTQRYAHLAQDPLKRSADRISAAIATALTGSAIQRQQRKAVD
jgi:integrase